MKNSIRLSNGVEMPFLFQGLPLIMGLKNIDSNQYYKIIKQSVESGIWGFDTSHEYGKSEEYLGKSINHLLKEGISREHLFITTKIGNEQQYEGNIERYVDMSLKTIGLDYLDVVLLHWPVPGLYIPNWKKLEKVFKKEKIRAIGLANPKVRHLEALLASDIEIVPHVIQTEIHPFNSCMEIRQFCKNHNISIQSCSSLCLMIDKVTHNPVLNDLAAKKKMSVAQVMLRWLIQNKISPVFRAFKPKHINEMERLFEYVLSEEEMSLIDGLNENYRYHPESINCAGF